MSRGSRELHACTANSLAKKNSSSPSLHRRFVPTLHRRRPHLGASLSGSSPSLERFQHEGESGEKRMQRRSRDWRQRPALSDSARRSGRSPTLGGSWHGGGMASRERKDGDVCVGHGSGSDRQLCASARRRRSPLSPRQHCRPACYRGPPKFRRRRPFSRVFSPSLVSADGALFSVVLRCLLLCSTVTFLRIDIKEKIVMQSCIVGSSLKQKREVSAIDLICGHKRNMKPIFLLDAWEHPVASLTVFKYVSYV